VADILSLHACFGLHGLSIKPNENFSLHVVRLSINREDPLMEILATGKTGSDTHLPCKTELGLLPKTWSCENHGRGPDDVQNFILNLNEFCERSKKSTDLTQLAAYLAGRTSIRKIPKFVFQNNFFTPKTSYVYLQLLILHQVKRQ
jgi:hypothetical protein